MTQVAELEFGRDVQGFNAYAPIPAVIIYSATITNADTISLTVPQFSQEWIVSFIATPGTDIFVDFTGTAATIPAGNTFAQTSSTQNPGARFISSLKPDPTNPQSLIPATISVTTDNTETNITVEFYANRS